MLAAWKNRLKTNSVWLVMVITFPVDLVDCMVTSDLRAEQVEDIQAFEILDLFDQDSFFHRDHFFWISSFTLFICLYYIWAKS
jgi:hypothetical protein